MLNIYRLGDISRIPPEHVKDIVYALVTFDPLTARQAKRPNAAESRAKSSSLGSDFLNVIYERALLV